MTEILAELGAKEVTKRFLDEKVWQLCVANGVECRGQCSYLPFSPVELVCLVAISSWSLSYCSEQNYLF